jgi:MoxR-like ATPase
MGYPTAEEGSAILSRFKTENPLDSIVPVASAEELIDASRSFSAVYTSPAMLQYIIKIAEETRAHTDIILGVSPRGTQALLRTVQVHAILAGRDYITPDDVKAMAYPVFGHRIILKNTARVKKGMTGEIIAEILNKVAVPTEEMSDNR